MTLTNESLELLKTDTGGRVRTSPERREALLDEFERSGLSGMRFAARYGLKYPTFASWVARRRRERMELNAAEEAGTSPAPDTGGRPVAPVRAVRWLEAVTEDGAASVPVPAAPARGVILHLPDGVRMEVTHADLHDQTAARRMMEAFRGIHFVGDKGFDSLSFRKALDEHGATGSTIPRKGFARLADQPAPFDQSLYRQRHQVENLFQRLKAHKRIALRADKTASSFGGFVILAGILDRLHRP